jgi:hypothetical protein
MNRAVASSAQLKVPGRSRIRLPLDTLLTGRVITTAAQRLSDSELAEVIEVLIGEMDRRTGDPDFESEPEEEDL